jgi:hypothetical protein
VFSDHFDPLMSKIILLKKIKIYIILIHFRVKKTLKNNCNYIFKYSLKKTRTHQTPTSHRNSTFKEVKIKKLQLLHKLYQNKKNKKYVKKY